MIKNYLYVFISIILLSACNSDSPQLIIKKVDDSVITITQNEMVETSYILMNPSNEKLIINDFDLSCPCTSTNLKENTIIPANSSYKATFVIDGNKFKPGSQSLVTVALRANTKPNFHILKMNIKAL